MNYNNSDVLGFTTGASAFVDACNELGASTRGGEPA